MPSIVSNLNCSIFFSVCTTGKKKFVWKPVSKRKVVPDKKRSPEGLLVANKKKKKEKKISKLFRTKINAAKPLFVFF